MGLVMCRTGKTDPREYGWLRRKEIAELLGLSVNSIRSKVAKGDIERITTSDGTNWYRLSDDCEYEDDIDMIGIRVPMDNGDGLWLEESFNEEKLYDEIWAPLSGMMITSLKGVKIKL